MATLHVAGGVKGWSESRVPQHVTSRHFSRMDDHNGEHERVTEFPMMISPFRARVSETQVRRALETWPMAERSDVELLERVVVMTM